MLDYGVLERWREEVQRLRTTWDALAVRDQVSVGAWRTQALMMREREQGLRAGGVWTRGPLDLMSVLRVDRSELAHCAALGWLLDPEGSHRSGRAFLDLVTDAVGAPRLDEPVEVQLEETRGDTGRVTRADIVCRGRSAAVLFEVKVDAGEQPEQATRLHELWEGDVDTRVFLTPSGRTPTTAGTRADAWHVLPWSQVSRLLDEALDGHDSTAALQYALTLRRLFRRSA